VVSLRYPVLGVDDLDRAEAFWSALLGYRPRPGHRTARWSTLDPDADADADADAGPSLALQLSTGPVQPWPRLHLDPAVHGSRGTPTRTTPTSSSSRTPRATASAWWTSTTGLPDRGSAQEDPHARHLLRAAAEGQPQPDLDQRPARAHPPRHPRPPLPDPAPRDLLPQRVLPLPRHHVHRPHRRLHPTTPILDEAIVTAATDSAERFSRQQGPQSPSSPR
jgi:hypothetical protein